MGSGVREKFDNPVVEWIDSRLPIFTIMQKEYGVFPAPRNFNYFWNFGAIALIMLMTMIVTGIILAMHYTANTHMAFDSVERIMRDVNGGWLLRYIHMNGASFFFIAVYIHIFRGMYYGSYKRPRELLWILGVLIFLLMMATAFIGYVLPWGQMSLWGATVITNLFSSIPFIGDDIVTLLWGGFSVDNPTLTRFFALHYLLPFVIFAVVFLHIWALHVTGSNNPLGIEPQSEKDTLPFHPYYTMKDTFGTIVFLMIYAVFIFYMPDALGHPDNYIPANPLSTPAHIVPEWYFLPFYAILRAITFNMNVYMLAGLGILAVLMVEFIWRHSPRFLNTGTGILLLVLGGSLSGFGFITDLNQQWGVPLTAAESAPIPAKLGGVLAMFGAIAVLFVLPWLDSHPVRSARFRPLYRVFFLIFALSVVILGYIGSQPADAMLVGVPLSLFGLALTGYYFGFFLVILPLLARFEKAKALPASIHEAVLAKSAAKHGVALLCAIILGFSQTAQASDAHTPSPPTMAWSFDGAFGTYDKASLQRGYKIYREVCASCHSMKRVYFRNLEALGYDEGQIKNIAAEYTYATEPNEEGDIEERAGLPSDPFKSPFANDNAAKYANNGALPPDLSLITKARANGSNYVYALMTGYENPPHGQTLSQGQHWNKYFSGHKIAMAPPLSDGLVAYEDGTPQTLDQYARDISHFLTWAADPYMEERKRTGFKVLFFLCVFAVIMYAVKRRIWADAH